MYLFPSPVDASSHGIHPTSVAGMGVLRPRSLDERGMAGHYLTLDTSRKIRRAIEAEFGEDFSWYLYRPGRKIGTAERWPALLEVLNGEWGWTLPQEDSRQHILLRVGLQRIAQSMDKPYLEFSAIHLPGSESYGIASVRVVNPAAYQHHSPELERARRLQDALSRILLESWRAQSAAALRREGSTLDGESRLEDRIGQGSSPKHKRIAEIVARRRSSRG